MPEQDAPHIDETTVVAEARHYSGMETRRPISLMARLAGMLKPQYDGPPSWLWYTALARLMILFVVAAGTQRIGAQVVSISILISIFFAAITCSLWYLLTLHRGKTVTSKLTWTQVFVDFSVVAVTVGFTGGSESLFTFLFIILILEAGALMGLVQGFVFSILAALFLLSQDYSAPLSDGIFPYWYNFLIRCMALFSTAVISGYWNQRISRLKQFQREILDNMSSGFFICNPRGQVFAANTVACKVLALDGDAVVGKNIAEILVCDSGAECPVITVLRNERDYASYEFAARTKADEVKQIGLTTNRLYDPRNRLIALIISFTDLTEIAQMRQTLQRQVRLAAVGESAAELTHEIRNPLTSLRSAVEELSKHLDMPDMTQRLCAIALRESEHLNKIVSGFLDYARNPDFNRDAINVAVLLQDISGVITQTAPDVSITVNVEDAASQARGDATQIRQLFDNIVRNSIDAMNGKGAISISARNAGHYLEIRVDDSGPGIPPDKMARIFEPFYTDKDKGIGMGLAICLRIVTAHDGAIQAANRSGGGASMIVKLPLERP